MQRSGTTLIALPPAIVPTLTVVSLVDAPERQRGDRAGGGEDRAATLLGADAGVRGGAVEVGLDAEVRGRVDDHLADRRGVVEHVAELARRRRCVERARAGQRDLLADGEQQLEVDRRACAAHVAREREQHGDGGLVVGAEDRLRCAFSQ